MVKCSGKVIFLKNKYKLVHQYQYQGSTYLVCNIHYKIYQKHHFVNYLLPKGSIFRFRIRISGEVCFS